uniref:Transposase Tc1-like domain-containing protein n=1 Tax=Astyanax mexicanus TaxID=7994 RepID=A0A8B9HMM4_ASTMX
YGKKKNIYINKVWLLAISKTGIQKIIKRYKENGTPNNRARSGRPPKLSPSDKMYLQLSSLVDRTRSCSTLASDLKICTGVSVHPATVRKQLKAMGLKGCVRKSSAKKDTVLYKCNLIHSFINTFLFQSFPSD